MKDSYARADIADLRLKMDAMDQRIQSAHARIGLNATDSQENFTHFDKRLRAIEERFIKKCKTCGHQLEEHSTASE